jgi:NDP-sugar pyrophosphorylase family protein/aminoglycoside/choline kinase family phosphotransferase
MNESFSVFFLAAGLGERLRPITAHIPKPLLPILGKPLLQILLEKVFPLMPSKIGMNLHYKCQDITDWIINSRFSKEIVLFAENPILGTGGALKNAESFLSGNTFLVHNTDILSEIDLERLIDAHQSSGNLATLAIHNFRRFNNVLVDRRGYLKGIKRSLNDKTSSGKVVAFAGIAVYNPEFFEFLPNGASSVVEAWLAATAAGCRIGTLDISGSYWTDIGTPSSYAAAVIRTLRAEGETVYIHPTVKGCPHATIEGFVAIEEKSLLGKGITIKNCIILAGSSLKEDMSYENSLVGPDFVVPLDEREILGISPDDPMITIGTGGSNRKYFRMREGARSAVLVRFERDDPDFDRYISYTNFFRRYNIPVPALLGQDREKREALLEDLGDLSLYSWLKCRRPASEVELLYRKVIDIAVKIHNGLTEHLSDCALLQGRAFNYDHLRWETDYFIERFVKGLRVMVVNNASSLEEEFHRLAVRVDSYPKTVIHRDFQAQNIMMVDGMPWLIDYQGARIGPPAYDLASLLWDPYYPIEGIMKTRLLHYYTDAMKKNVKKGFDEDAFLTSLLPCRVQRHMQALGAYGFLSQVKGRRFFLKYVEEGLRLLKEDVSALEPEYPALYRLVKEL